MVTEPPPPPPLPPFLDLLRSPPGSGSTSTAAKGGGAGGDPLPRHPPEPPGGSSGAAADTVSPPAAAQLGNSDAPRHDGQWHDEGASGSGGSSRLAVTAAAEPPALAAGSCSGAGGAAQVAGCGPGAVPNPAHPAHGARSLQECCCRVICRHLSVHNCLELLSVCGDCGRGEAPALAELGEAALRYAAQSFETLQGLRSEAELRVALPEGMYDALAAAVADRVAAVAERRAALGRVREREAAAGDAAAPVEGPSVAGRPVCYPAAALLAGMAWPADVDGGRREEWLSASDFAGLFGGLDWAQYSALPGWKRERLKKAAGLF